MKLDVNALRYLSKDEFRVLTAVEMGMKNHEIVPVELIDRIAGLKHGGGQKNVKTLLRQKLVHHDASKYDGYRLTTLGYDFLAIRTMVNRGLVVGVGRQIGVGKESDVFEVLTEDGETLALKLHRLGRTSFRAVKSKRDYLKHRNSYNWLYLSRLAALKEFAFMKALDEHGFPVPKAVDWNRHCVLMSLVQGYPLAQVKQLQNPGSVFETVVGYIVRLAQHGLIHCDFNEFNILIDDNENTTIIDFPQMVSVSHPNAEMYFDRDVNCIYEFFTKRFTYSQLKESCKQTGLLVGLITDSGFDEDDGQPNFRAIAKSAASLDKELAASGFTHQIQNDLERFVLDLSENESISEEEQDTCALSEKEIEILGNKNQLSKISVSEDGSSLQIGDANVDGDPVLSVTEGDNETESENDSRYTITDKMEKKELQECFEDMFHHKEYSDRFSGGDLRLPSDNAQHKRSLEKQRKKVIAEARGRNRLHSSRNSSKGKSGSRSYNSNSRAKFDF
eukprot:c19875_g1_i1 orf=271-1782(-)